jgi:hypothetical protein
MVILRKGGLLTSYEKNGSSSTPLFNCLFASMLRNALNIETINQLAKKYYLNLHRKLNFH